VAVVGPAATAAFAAVLPGEAALQLAGPVWANLIVVQQREAARLVLAHQEPQFAAQAPQEVSQLLVYSEAPPQRSVVAQLKQPH
jgi:hypothetical protein